MVLMGFHTILLGAKLHIQPDHLNFTTNNTTPDCIICWFNYVEQYIPYIHFISGKDNVIANTLSWLNSLKESVLSRTNTCLLSKIPSPKGWTLLMIHSSSNAPYTYHFYQSMISFQLTINGFLPNKMKLIFFIQQQKTKVSRQIFQ